MSLKSTVLRTMLKNVMELREQYEGDNTEYEGKVVQADLDGVANMLEVAVVVSETDDLPWHQSWMNQMTWQT